MRLVMLSEEYVVDLHRLDEAHFYPSDGTNPARLELFVRGQQRTTMYDDEAVTAWHRLRDLTDEAGEGDRNVR